jgi:hypothetical protein
MPISPMQQLTARAILAEAQSNELGDTGIVDSPWVNQRLARMMRERGMQVGSASECAQGHIAALVRKGLAVRPWRGAVQLTAEGVTAAS